MGALDGPRRAVLGVTGLAGADRRGDQIRGGAGDPAAPGSRRDMYVIRAEPGKPRVSAPHARGVLEHVVISAGRARLGPSDAAEVLGPGDYICYPGDVEHVFDALEPGTVAVMLSEAF